MVTRAAAERTLAENDLSVVGSRVVNQRAAHVHDEAARIHHHIAAMMLGTTCPRAIRVRAANLL